MTSLLPLETNIEIGQHTTGHFLGMTFNLDTIWATVVAGAIVLIMGFVVRRAVSRETADHVPTKLQLVWESVVSQVNQQVEENLGRLQPFVVPLAIALFFFILIANWLELIPSQPNTIELLPAPTSDTNLTYAMSITAMVGVWVYGVREQGAKNYLLHFFRPIPVLAPLNILEELVKPVTLALRLFGNIFAGGIMLSLIGLLPFWGLIPGNIIWKLFDMFIGGIQAFIFGLLTIIYFGMAGAGHGDEKHEQSHEQPVAQVATT